MSQSILAQILASQMILRIPIHGRNRYHRGRVLVGYALVRDDRYGRRMASLSWYLDSNGYPSTSEKLATGRRRHVQLHHFVYEHYHGHLPEGMIRDHRDRNPYNALPTNLRAVSPSVNVANKGRQRNNRSGYPGVSWNQEVGKWKAQIQVKGKNRFLGNHACIHAAARAVNAAYRLHFPEVDIPNPSAEPGAAPPG